jgi:hypothetical protein
LQIRLGTGLAKLGQISWASPFHPTLKKCLPKVHKKIYEKHMCHFENTFPKIRKPKKVQNKVEESQQNVKGMYR